MVCNRGRRILGIFWPHTISNCDLYERTKQRPISETVKVRRWRWIGHILRREKDKNCRVALTWTPEGRRKRGRPKISWRRTVEGERKDLGWTSWNVVEQRAKDREGWRTFLGGLMLQLGMFVNKLTQNNFETWIIQQSFRRYNSRSKYTSVFFRS
ncbi:hypothetical protein ACROYT_G020033 [Oculina patagonica]